MQLFATHYLQRFASDDHEKQEGLEHYFHAVLCAVHRGRLAKDRVLAFAEREAVKNPRSAALFARIMGRLAATPLVGDKSRAIQILVAIAARFPDISTPLTVQTPRRHAV